MSAAEDKAEIRKRLEMLEDRSAAGGGRATAQQVRSMRRRLLLLPPPPLPMLLLVCDASAAAWRVSSAGCWLVASCNTSLLRPFTVFFRAHPRSRLPTNPRSLQPAKAGGGFGVVHLLLVALLAFLVSCCLQSGWLAQAGLHAPVAVAGQAVLNWSTGMAACVLPAQQRHISGSHSPKHHAACPRPPQVGHFANISVPLLTDWLHSIVGKAAAGGSATGSTEL